MVHPRHRNTRHLGELKSSPSMDWADINIAAMSDRKNNGVVWTGLIRDEAITGGHIRVATRIMLSIVSNGLD